MSEQGPIVPDSTASPTTTPSAESGSTSDTPGATPNENATGLGGAGATSNENATGGEEATPNEDATDEEEETSNEDATDGEEETPNENVTGGARATAMNEDTKILTGFYHQRVIHDKIYTMYRQVNGIVCKAVQTYNQPLTVVQNVVQGDARLVSFEVHMDGLNLRNAEKGRCRQTHGVVGQIKRKKPVDRRRDARDSEVIFHLIPSRAGANAGDAYANAVPASRYLNNLENHYIWSKAMKNCIGERNFSMTVTGTCGDIDQEYKGVDEKVDDIIKKRLMKRYELILAKEPRAYRLKSCVFKVQLPSSATQQDLDAISDATSKAPQIRVEKDVTSKSVTFYFPEDTELFKPRDVTELDENGELYPGELKEATKKQEKLTVGEKPEYKVDPEKAFCRQFDEWAK